MSSDLLQKMIANISTTESIEKMRAENEEKAEKKRLELAGAITRLVINDALRDVRARKQMLDEVKAKGETEA